MASSAPQEILDLIAHHLAQLDKKLSPYALVNKYWQAAFEPYVYSTIVVRSPYDVKTIRKNIGWHTRDELLHERGPSLETFINMTSGPRDWQRARRRYVRQIVYRVVVPYWLDKAREKDDGYTYNNVHRCENNQAFSEGVCQLFEHLSTWINQAISLKIALQAIDVSTREEDGESKSIATVNMTNPTGEEIAPYCAEFVPGCVLPRASCITSLEFLELITPNTICALDFPAYENEISLPARLSIASACSALENIRLDRGDEIPLTEPIMRATRRSAAAEGFAQLPRTITDMTLCWDAETELGIDNFRQSKGSALQKFSTQLQHLRIESLAIYQEVFCPDGLGLTIEVHWPYLETLHLKNQFCEDGPLGGVENAAEAPLIERYLNNLYTSLGLVTQKMPCLKSVILTFTVLDHELELSIRNNRWNLTLCVMDNYQPSPEVLEAWKVPGRSLQPCINRYWQETTYSSWPPV
ncbi:hypothetical protein E4T44_01086 [Aureobasidium sp. EXF-8845]|nr:hypothetical protein E4T44_01086 [Aureobasidium sp. EXF-8845]KAI4857478.1 hypothetical protein E4T45_01031 [Aureobasidium sp. EXF-8846]